MKVFYFSAALLLAICGATGCAKVHAQDEGLAQEAKPKTANPLIDWPNWNEKRPDCPVLYVAGHDGTTVLSVDERGCYKLVTQAPFDRKPEEWEQEVCVGMPDLSGRKLNEREEEILFIARAAGKCSESVHKSVCTIPGTHQPDPQRFPIQDATGATHCLALLQRSQP